jgi:hypothetical protein
VSKYIPKVGEEFEFYSMTVESWCKRPKVFAITDKELVYLDDRGKVTGLCLHREFRPIKTKLDVERKQLLEIIEECYDSGCSIITKEIQQAGFTIPKKIKRSELFQVVANTSTAIVQNDELVVDAICELLGDLVEKDEKRGAE